MSQISEGDALGSVKWLNAANASNIVDWIRQEKNVTPGSISSVLPPGFNSYLTMDEVSGFSWAAPNAAERTTRLLRFLDLPRQASAICGFLDAGFDPVAQVVADRVFVYADWKYVFGQLESAEGLLAWPALPDILIASDLSWIVSTLQGDTRTCCASNIEAHEMPLGARKVGYRDQVFV